LKKEFAKQLNIFVNGSTEVLNCHFQLNLIQALAPPPLMKRFAIILTIVLLATPAFAQRDEYAITTIAPQGITTPDYQVTGEAHKSPRRQIWLEVEVEFESKAETTDELTVKYFVLLKDKLLSGEVTHVNVPKGRDLRSVIYVPPQTLSRLLEGRPLGSADIVNVGVQLLVKGALAAESNYKPAGAARWWEQLQPLTGLMMNKTQTPFAPLYWDRYEMIKPEAR
jgi:hypothetical protein